VVTQRLNAAAYHAGQLVHAGASFVFPRDDVPRIGSYIDAAATIAYKEGLTPSQRSSGAY